MAPRASYSYSLGCPEPPSPRHFYKQKLININKTDRDIAKIYKLPKEPPIIGYLYNSVFPDPITDMKRKASTQKGKPALKKQKSSFYVPAGDYQKGRELLKTPKQELKAFDVALTTTLGATIAGPPAFNVLNAITNGAELYQRVGRKTYMKSLHFRAQLTPSGVATEAVGRIVIFYDSQPNAANPVIAGLLQDSNAAAATTWISEINLTNRQRFKILRDYQVLMGSSTNIGGANEIIIDPIKNSFNIDMFIKLGGLETIYNATNGGTIADITSGALHMVFFGDANISYNLNWSSRLRYYD